MSDIFVYTNSKGQAYYLHGMMVTLKNGHRQKIYYFAREINADYALTEVPAGYAPMETKRTGMPVLKKV